MGECPICLDAIKEPKTLICGHTFCQVCLKSTEQLCGKRCALCRTIYDTSVTIVNEKEEDKEEDMGCFHWKKYWRLYMLSFILLSLGMGIGFIVGGIVLHNDMYIAGILFGCLSLGCGTLLFTKW